MAYISAPMLFVCDLKPGSTIQDKGESTESITYWAGIALVGTCENYVSLLWDIEYYTVGSFEIYLPATANALALFQVDRVVIRDDDAENIGIIESVLIEHDSENGDFMTVSGRFLQSLLSRRVVYPTAYSTEISSDLVDDGVLPNTDKTYGNMIRYVLAGCREHRWYLVGDVSAGTIASCAYDGDGNYTYFYELTSAKSGRRMIPGLGYQFTQSDVWDARIGTLSGDSDTTSGTMQVTGKNVMDWIYTICELVHGTIKIDVSTLISGLHTQYTLMCHMPIVFTQGDDKRDTVVFSGDMQTLTALSYSENFEEYSNFAYALGSGDGIARLHSASHTPDAAASGFDRREIFVSASNGDETGDTTTTVTACDLMQAGLEALTPPTYAAEANVVPDGAGLTYGTDYTVGDIVTVRYESLGLSIDARLTGMVESFDQTGRTLTPTFSFDEDFDN